MATIAVGFSLGGCRTVPPDLGDSGLTDIELVPADRGYYRDIHVNRAGGETVIRGHVKRFIEPGHVHVQLLSTDGTVVAEDRVKVSPPPRSSRVRHAAFAARLTIPSSPACVRITHDRTEPDARRKE